MWCSVVAASPSPKWCGTPQSRRPVGNIDGSHDSSAPDHETPPFPSDLIPPSKSKAHAPTPSHASQRASSIGSLASCPSSSPGGGFLPVPRHRATEYGPRAPISKRIKRRTARHRRRRRRSAGDHQAPITPRVLDKTHHNSRPQPATSAVHQAAMYPWRGLYCYRDSRASTAPTPGPSTVSKPRCDIHGVILEPRTSP